MDASNESGVRQWVARGVSGGSTGTRNAQHMPVERRESCQRGCPARHRPALKKQAQCAFDEFALLRVSSGNTYPRSGFRSAACKQVPPGHSQRGPTRIVSGPAACRRGAAEKTATAPKQYNGLQVAQLHGHLRRLAQCLTRCFLPPLLLQPRHWRNGCKSR